GAVEDYDEVLRLRPSHARAWHNRGVARALLGDAAGGLADLDRAVALDPLYAMTFYNRAVTHASRQALAEARRDYDRALELNPRHAEAFNNRGVLRARAGDFAGAVEDYERAIALKPGYAAAFQNRGLAKARRGDLEGAAADYGEALRIEPGLVEAAFNRGCVRFVEGDGDAAADDFRRVLRDAPAGWPRRADAETSLAWAEGLSAVDDGPSPGPRDLRRAERAIRLGHIDVALPLYERGLASGDAPAAERARAAYNLACCYAVTSLHRPEAERGSLLDRALERLAEVEKLGALDVRERCCAGRHASLRAHARDDEDLAPLRSDPRFRKLVDRTPE
ncbi:MAG TPA: tetratricopeptide repeat protein, partial [Planctomycetota bacterium]|nr:tetratricopeptide repeat protein [Planctomycetota bacterium]